MVIGSESSRFDTFFYSVCNTRIIRRPSVVKPLRVRAAVQRVDATALHLGDIIARHRVAAVEGGQEAKTPESQR
jgi:hypothetical protein